MIVLTIGDWRSLAIRAAASPLFGVLALVWPDITVWALVFLFGAYVLVDGISILVAVFRGVPAVQVHRGVHIFEGIASVGIGIVTFVWPHATALALLYLIAAWAFTTGTLEIIAALRLRREIPGERILGLIGALSVVFSIVLVITPGAGALAITWLIGTYAVTSGVLYAALAWRLRKVEREVGAGGGELIGRDTDVTR